MELSVVYFTKSAPRMLNTSPNNVQITRLFLHEEIVKWKTQSIKYKNTPYLWPCMPYVWPHMLFYHKPGRLDANHTNLLTKFEFQWIFGIIAMICRVYSYINPQGNDQSHMVIFGVYPCYRSRCCWFPMWMIDWLTAHGQWGMEWQPRRSLICRGSSDIECQPGQ